MEVEISELRVNNEVYLLNVPLIIHIEEDGLYFNARVEEFDITESALKLHNVIADIKETVSLYYTFFGSANESDLTAKGKEYKKKFDEIVNPIPMKKMMKYL
jgi:hypothetical protein